MEDFPYPLPMLLDGATGTALEAAGMPADIYRLGGIGAEQWILQHPDALRSLQNAYICLLYTSPLSGGPEQWQPQKLYWPVGLVHRQFGLLLPAIGHRWPGFHGHFQERNDGGSTGKETQECIYL